MLKTYRGFPGHSPAARLESDLEVVGLAGEVFLLTLPGTLLAELPTVDESPLAMPLTAYGVASLENLPEDGTIGGDL